jgi:hypothetical protein
VEVGGIGRIERMGERVDEKGVLPDAEILQTGFLFSSPALSMLHLEILASAL